MKKLIYLLLLVLIITPSVFAQINSAKLSPLTRKYLSEIKKETNEQNLLKNIVYKKQGNDFYISALIKVNSDLNETQLNAMGVLTGTKAGNIWTVQIPFEKAEAFTLINGIDYIQFDEACYPDLDNSRTDTRVDSVHQGINLPMIYNGEGVVVGVVDAGYDFEHPAFFDTTGTGFRVKKVWMQKNNSGLPPSGYAYGTELTDSVSMWTAGNDNGGTHATHVGGICAGSGFGSTGNNKYRGFAYKSDLVFVAITPDKSQWISTGVSDMIDGINYIFSYANSVSKPAVVNLSWGSPLGPRDGTGLFSQALDNITGPGKIFVCSAGNNGDNPIHLQKTFNAGDTIIHTFLEIASTPEGNKTWIDAWGDSAKSFCMQVSLYNNSIIDSTGFICLDDSIHDLFLLGSNNDTCFITIITSSAEFNMKPRIFLDFNSNVTDSVLISMKSTDGTVHMWNTFVSNTSGYYGEFKSYGYPWAVNGDVNITISDIASSKSAITVGAYVSKKNWVDVLGQPWSYGSIIRGDLAFFSSRGPTVDGRVKPDITGPGMTVASAISSYDSSYFPGTGGYDYIVSLYHNPVNNRDYTYGQLSGTSMSSPAVSGITALMLQVKNDLSPQMVKNIFTQTAITDGFTGILAPGGDNLWGTGKVNAYGAVSATVQIVTGIEFIRGEIPECNLYPNPNEGIFNLEYSGKKNETIQIKIYDLTGRYISGENWKTYSGTNSRLFNLNGFTAGIYFVKLTSEKGEAVIKMTVKN